MLLGDAAKGAIMVFPPTRAIVLRRRKRRGYDPSKDSSRYVLEVFHRHFEAVGANVAGRVLEIGPGGNVATAALFIQHGAEAATVIDTEGWMHDSPVYRALGVEDVLSRVEYLCPVAIEHAALPSDSFDLIYSHACYEHFSDLGAATMNIARMLKPGGMTSHVIDLRDHRDFSRPLDFLKLNEWRWRLASSHRSMPTNRWRASDLRAAFEQARLTVERFEITERAAIDEVTRESFATPFREKALEDLAITGLFIVARKP